LSSGHGGAAALRHVAVVVAAVRDGLELLVLVEHAPAANECRQEVRRTLARSPRLKLKSRLVPDPNGCVLSHDDDEIRPCRRELSNEKIRLHDEFYEEIRWNARNIVFDNGLGCFQIGVHVLGFHAMAGRRNNIPVELSDEAQRVVAEACRNYGMKKKDLVTRIMRFFAGSVEEVKALMLGHIPPSMITPVAKLMLEQLAKVPVDGKTEGPRPGSRENPLPPMAVTVLPEPGDEIDDEPPAASEPTSEPHGVADLEVLGPAIPPGRERSERRRRKVKMRGR
jgi:hypothetical protein